MKEIELRENLELLHKNFLESNNVSKTLSTLHTLIQTLIKYKLYNNIYYIFYILSSIYQYGLEDFINGMLYLERSFKFSKNTCNLKDTFLISKNLIIYNLNLNNNNKASSFLNIAKNTFDLSELDIYIGIIHYNNGFYKDSLKLLEKYSKFNIITSDYLLAKIYLINCYLVLENYNGIEEISNELSVYINEFEYNLNNIPLLVHLLVLFKKINNKVYFLELFTNLVEKVIEFRLFRTLFKIYCLKAEYIGYEEEEAAFYLKDLNFFTTYYEIMQKNTNKIIDKLEVIERDLRVISQFEIGDFKFNELSSTLSTSIRIYNFQDFEKFLKYDIDYLNIEKMSIIFLTINNFYDLTDTYGENKGSRLLIKVIELIRSIIRSSDIIFSYNKSSYLILFKGVSINETIKIGRKIKNTIDEDPLIQESDKLLSTKIVVKEFSLENDKFNIEEILSIAEEVLDYNPDNKHNYFEL